MSFRWNSAPLKYNLAALIKDARSHKENSPVPEENISPLLSLPAEILNIIAQFLTVKDLISCSATCSLLRSVFNDNFIWRKFCKNNIIEYLKFANQKLDVDYNFSTLKCDLPLICQSRIDYIQQNQLLNNWKNGKFVEREIHSSSGLYYMCLKSGTAIIYKEIYLFLYDFFAHNIIVWNVEDIPVRYTSIKLLYHNYFYEGLHYEIVGQSLVVVEVGKLVQIYGINLPDKTIPLLYIILVDRNEPLNKIPYYNTPEEMYSVCYHNIIGDKIYSHKIGKPVLHIWDIQTGRKVSALEPPTPGCNFDVLSAANNGNDLILCLEVNDPQRQFNAFGTVHEVLTYSFSRDFFKTLWTNKNPLYTCYVPFHAIQHGDLVILFCRINSYIIEDETLPKTLLVFYDYKWAVIIGEKSFPELTCHRQSQVVNGQLLLATAFCVYLMDLVSYEIVLSFKFDCGKIELLNVFDANFIITTPKALVSVTKTKRKEVWDIKNRKKCLSITYVFTSPHLKDSVFVNQSCTKMIVVGKGTLGILNFW